MEDLYPLADAVVDGRRVLANVDNTDSIGATLVSYSILPGIREVSMLDFPGITGFTYSAEINRSITELAQRIQDSNTISPLIVVVDRDGPYVLEGSKRVDALKRLGAKTFPAVVVIDEEN